MKTAKQTHRPPTSSAPHDHSKSTDRTLPSKGLTSMVASCILFAAMSAIIYHVQLVEPTASVLVSSFFRIIVNLLLLLGHAALTGCWVELVGDRRPSLWWRGVFGTLALMASFAAIRAIGIGEASFLTASNGVFVAALAPIFLGQRNSPKVWIAIGGALIGLFLLFEPRFSDAMPLGRALALISGAFSALAYLMIARAGRSNSAQSVIFYFCIVATVLHAILFVALRPAWPMQVTTYAWLTAAGLFGSIAQIFLTNAYQTAPAALNSAVSYLQPVLNMLLSVLLFAKAPDAKAVTGAVVVLVFGVALPFVRLPHTSHRSE